MICYTHDERQCRNERKEQPRPSRCQIRDDHFHQQDDHRIPNLVQHSTARELRNAIRSGLYDGADNVEDNADDDELDSSEYVSDFGSGWLEQRGRKQVRNDFLANDTA